MTNTGDFRRYSYSRELSGAISAFSAEQGSAAPKRRPRTETEPELKVVNGVKKSYAEHLKEQRAARVKAVKICLSALLIFSMLIAVVYSYVLKNELTKEISKIQNDISIAQSENTRLNSELDALVSMKMIDEYAVERLGMTKIQKNQINYIDVSEFKAQREKELAQKSPDDYAKALK